MHYNKIASYKLNGRQRQPVTCKTVQFYGQQITSVTRQQQIQNRPKRP